MHKLYWYLVDNEVVSESESRPPKDIRLWSNLVWQATTKPDNTQSIYFSQTILPSLTGVHPIMEDEADMLSSTWWPRRVIAHVIRKDELREIEETIVSRDFAWVRSVSWERFISERRRG